MLAREFRMDGRMCRAALDVGETGRDDQGARTSDTADAGDSPGTRSIGTRTRTGSSRATL